MKKFSAAILLGLAGLGLAGCSGSATNTVATNANSRTDTMVSNANSNQAVVINSNAGTTGSSTSTTDAVSGMTAPNGFMMEAARGGMAEVELSKLATTKAQNPEVKKFAQQMIQDHTNANTELKQLAGKKNVTLPTELDAEHKALKDSLSSLSGAAFDKAYINAMVSDHEKTVNLFKTQADSGTDADAKAFATKTLPKLQGHLDMIKSMESKMK
ncbi:hypothetical protein BH24ACI1_BH24ACI1_19870 [soil metagenome]|jgi:putative membrane protein|nr:DUF4142 domain-containing protein [Pyrinomonadaceae bacterium]